MTDPATMRSRARYLPPPLCDDLPDAPDVDLSRLYRHRRDRLLAEMARLDFAACILTDPVNIRYATGTRNMQIFTARNPARYTLILASGRTVLFEFAGCAHLAEGGLVDEVHPATTVSYVAAGDNEPRAAMRWADELADIIRTDAGVTRFSAGGKIAVGIERINFSAAKALEAHGFLICDAQAAVERARAIKSADELACIRHSIAVTDRGVAAIRDSLRPGMSENELWTLLHSAIIAADGDYVETRLMSSGTRTAPWFQECSDKKITAGELLGLDTDVVGPFGYYADYSRTFYCGKRGKPTARQREYYRLSLEQIAHNTALLRPGVSFRDISDRAWKIPPQHLAGRYFVLAHGVGMTGEYPYILHAADVADGYDGIVEEGMTLCVESYIGGAEEGVKLEQQVHITANGAELLSHFPLDDDLLGGREM